MPAEWFEPLMAERGMGLEVDGLPRRDSPFWMGVPPVAIGGRGSGGADGEDGGTIVYRRFVNGPHRFVWLVSMYDDMSDTAFGCTDLNYDDGGRWGPIPMRHVRMLGGRADAAWRPLPYADAVRHPARVRAPEAAAPLRIPSHYLVGFDAPPIGDDGDCGRAGARTIEIPRGSRPCGIETSSGEALYEYSYAGVPQGGAAVVLDTIYQGSDARAIALARRLDGSYRYAIRACRDDGACPLCRGRAYADRNGRGGRETAAATAQENGGGRQ